MMNLYLKRFFLECILIFSFNTVLLTQSLTNKNESADFVFSDIESPAIESQVDMNLISPDSIQNSDKIELKESNENSDTEYFKLKSKSGVFTFFNEIIFYWFHQL